MHHHLLQRSYLLFFYVIGKETVATGDLLHCDAKMLIILLWKLSFHIQKM